MKNSIIISIFTASLLLVTPVFSQRNRLAPLSISGRPSVQNQATPTGVIAKVKADVVKSGANIEQVIADAVKANPALSLQIAQAVFQALNLKAGDPNVGVIIAAVNNGLSGATGGQTNWIIQSPNTGDQQRNSNVDRVSPFALTNVAPV